MGSGFKGPKQVLFTYLEPRGNIHTSAKPEHILADLILLHSQVVTYWESGTARVL